MQPDPLRPDVHIRRQQQGADAHIIRPIRRIERQGQNICDNEVGYDIDVSNRRSLTRVYRDISLVHFIGLVDKIRVEGVREAAVGHLERWLEGLGRPPQRRPPQHVLAGDILGDHLELRGEVRRFRGQVILAAGLRGQLQQRVGVDVVAKGDAEDLHLVGLRQGYEGGHRVGVRVQQARIVVAVGHRDQEALLDTVSRAELLERSIHGIPAATARVIALNVVGLDAFDVRG